MELGKEKESLPEGLRSLTALPFRARKLGGGKDTRPAQNIVDDRWAARNQNRHDRTATATPFTTFAIIHLPLRIIPVKPMCWSLYMSLNGF